MALTDRDPNKEGSPRLKIIFAVILSVGLTFAATQIFNHSKKPETSGAQPSIPGSLPSAGGGGGPANLSAPPSPYQDPIGREERALAVTKLESFREQAKNVLEAVGVLEKELDMWEAQIEPLLFNDDGKWLASDEALVRYFQKLMSEERMTPITVSSIRTQVDEILTPVHQALQDQTELYIPSMEMSKTLTKLHTDAYNGARNYQKIRSQILAMVEDAKSSNEKATFTLQTAIARIEGDKARVRAELLAEEEKKVEEEIAQQLAELRRQTLEKEAEAEKQILLERQKLADQKAELEAKNIESQKLKELSEDKNTKLKFLPFLAKTEYTLYCGTPDVEYAVSKAVKWNHGAKASVNFTWLQRLGVYDNFDYFVKVATSRHGFTTRENNVPVCFYNDRPLWPTPKSKEDWDDYREKWELFKKLTFYWLQDGSLTRAK